MKKYIFSLFCLASNLLFSAAPSSQFASDFAKIVETQNSNWLFSPFSIQACLSMVAAGAEGETLEELKRVLGLSDSHTADFAKLLKQLEHAPKGRTDFQLSIAQGAWVRQGYPLLASFISTLENSFNASVDSVYFCPSTIDAINSWVEKKTGGKISDLLPYSAATPDTKLVLANALYFQGSWLFPFSKEETQLAPFTPLDSPPISVLTLHKQADFLYYEEEDFQAVLLPFSKEKSASLEPACLLLLPKEPSSRIDLGKISSILPKMKKEKIDLLVPKFKVEQSFDLSKSLQSLGIVRAFSKGGAEFTKITPFDALHISSVLHKAFFSFDEKGVEAAAATAVVVSSITSIDKQLSFPIPFHADRPFYFALLDKKTESLLFTGRILSP